MKCVHGKAVAAMGCVAFLIVGAGGCSIDDDGGTSIDATPDLEEAGNDLATVDGRLGEWTHRVNVDPLTDNSVANLSIVAHDYESQIGAALGVMPQLSLACDSEGRLWTFVWFNDVIVPRIASHGSRLRTDVAYRIDRGEVIETLAGVGDDSRSVVMTDYATLQLIERLLDKEELIFVVWDGDGTNRRVAHFSMANLRENQHRLSRCTSS